MDRQEWKRLRDRLMGEPLCLNAVRAGHAVHTILGPCPPEPIDLLTTTDPMVWAVEFVRIVRENNIDVAGEDAEGFMVGWFSNLLAAAEIKGNREALAHEDRAAGVPRYAREQEGGP